MKVVIELNSLDEIKRLLGLLKEFNIENFNIINNEETSLESSITKGDKSINFSELFGMWSDKPRTLKEIRQAGWDRK